MKAVLLLVAVVSFAAVTHAGPVDVVESASLSAIKESQKGTLDAISLGVKIAENILAKAAPNSDLAKAANGVRDHLRSMYSDIEVLFSQTLQKHQSTFKSLKG